MKTHEELFIEELTKLSNKYGIYISGCRCCDSPYLTEELRYADSDGELSYDKEDRKYILKK